MNKDTRVHIIISKKAENLRAEYILRENKKTLPHVHPASLGNKVHYRGGGMKLPVLPNQAGAVTYQGKGTYSFGDGDPQAKSALRPGSLDHLKYKSLEDKGTAIYKRHHP